MTIDSTFLKSFKEEFPEAYSSTPHSYRAKAIFSDGQIRLMQNPPSTTQHWDQYVHQRFVAWYSSLLAKNQHAHTVIVAFDNYQHVPMAKCMTQTARRKNVPDVQFGERNPLPCTVPEGQHWLSFMSNRTFKAKVIEYITLNLPAMFLARFPKKTLIIDYDVPVEHKFDSERKQVVAQELADLIPLGEADVKASRWCARYPDIVIDSVDGDTIPIMLAYYEQVCSGECTVMPEIQVYRMQTSVEAPKPANAGRKRKTSEAMEKPAKTKAGREYEYLSIAVLADGLHRAVRQVTGQTVIVSHNNHVLRTLVAMITLAGTDFTRHLPQVSGKFMWENLHALFMPLCMSYDVTLNQFRVDLAANVLVSRVYWLKFGNHLSSDQLALQDVLAELQASKLSPKTKDTMPSLNRIICTLRNCNWVLRYWNTVDGYAPDPLDDCRFGYVRWKNKVNYEDLVNTDPPTDTEMQA